MVANVRPGAKRGLDPLSRGSRRVALVNLPIFGLRRCAYVMEDTPGKYGPLMGLPHSSPSRCPGPSEVSGEPENDSVVA